MNYDVLIIGGGASGLMAACALSRFGARVALLEKQPRVGRKLLATGNGRCNFTNLKAKPANYHGSSTLARAALNAYPPEKIVRLFESYGVFARADEEGRAYPAGNQASAVLDALRLAADESGVDTVCDFAVTSLAQKKNLFTARSADGRSVNARFAIVCAGGVAAPKLGACADGYRILESCGHKITPRLPALVPIKTPPETVRALKGLRAQCDISLIADNRELRREHGEILFAEYGVSGIAVMQLSRLAGEMLAKKRRTELKIDFLAGMGAKDPLALLRGLRKNLPERAAEDLLTGCLPKRIAQTLLKQAGIAPLTRAAKTLADAELSAIADALTGWTLPVTGVQGFEQAQVTAGGADGREFDPDTLESRRAPGLFAAGEVLDVDGDCGGFNLQWAWASALMCADAIRARLRS